ncbi:hypothetical protein V8F20_005027 [Naviculisporaceae sp. PSN 640]
MLFSKDCVFLDSHMIDLVNCWVLGEWPSMDRYMIPSLTRASRNKISPIHPSLVSVLLGHVGQRSMVEISFRIHDAGHAMLRLRLRGTVAMYCGSPLRRRQTLQKRKSGGRLRRGHRPGVQSCGASYHRSTVVPRGGGPGGPPSCSSSSALLLVVRFPLDFSWSWFFSGFLPRRRLCEHGSQSSMAMFMRDHQKELSNHQTSDGQLVAMEAPSPSTGVPHIMGSVQVYTHPCNLPHPSLAPVQYGPCLVQVTSYGLRFPTQKVERGHAARMARRANAPHQPMPSFSRCRRSETRENWGINGLETPLMAHL